MVGKLRIIGGKWRSRKIIFPNLPDLRPTTDRIRETLFNWMASYIIDANCLDLFAGSGALGFEALSRGASHVTFVDHSRSVVGALKENVKILCTVNTVNAEVICGDFAKVIPLLIKIPYNIVFLDPPFYKNLLEKAALELELRKKQLLALDAFIYVETEKKLQSLVVPKNWEIYRVRETSVSSCRLFRSIRH